MVLDLGPFLDVIVGAAISAAVGFVTALITNRGHDRRLKIQLFNNDQKNAIAKLHELAARRGKFAADWMRGISEYLDTFEAQAFLPKEEMTWARSVVKKVSDKIDETYPEEAEIDRMQEELDKEGESDYLDLLNENQKKEYWLNKFLNEVIDDARLHLVKAVTGLASPKSKSRLSILKSKVKGVRKPKIRRLKRKQFT